MTSCADHLKFKGVCHFATTDLINNIELNLKLRFDWCFLQAGAFLNVSKDMAGPLSVGDWSSLKCVDGVGYKWISVRKEWVYEDITYIDIDGGTNTPTVPQIYIDNILQVSGYTINYPEGMVIFDAPVSISASVQASYSYRYVQTYISKEAPWWQELQQNSFNLNDMHFTQSDCGDWSIGTEHRIQMPTVIIDSIPIGSLSGYSLGESKRKATQVVLFHVFAEDKSTRNKIVDIVRMQGDTAICSFDANYAAIDSALPLSCGGDPTGMDYSELITNYPSSSIWIGSPNVRMLSSLKCGLFEARVDMPLEIVFIDCGV